VVLHQQGLQAPGQAVSGDINDGACVWRSGRSV
jgi:hypothetical protein